MISNGNTFAMIRLNATANVIPSAGWISGTKIGTRIAVSRLISIR